jgi:hypothetical protein
MIFTPFDAADIFALKYVKKNFIMRNGLVNNELQTALKKTVLIRNIDCNCFFAKI